MFDFLDTDWFVVGLEILLLIFIAWDIKHYINTRQKQYLFNIVLAIGFFIYTLYPYYIKYYKWSQDGKTKVVKVCQKDNNQSLCGCISEKIYKEYDEKMYNFLVSQNDKRLVDFLNESQKDCKEK